LFRVVQLLVPAQVQNVIEPVETPRSRVAGYAHVRAVGLAQMHSQFARLVRSHDAQLAEACRDFRSELQCAPLSRVTLCGAAVEASVTVRAQPKNAWFVLGAVDGPVRMTIGRRPVILSIGAIGVVPPGTPYQLHLPRGGCRTLLLEIEPGFLESIVAEESQDDVDGPVRFAQRTGLYGDGARHLLGLMNHLRNELAQGAPQCRHPAYVRRLGQLLGSALLHAAAHNYSARLDAETAVEPRFVRRAVDFMQAHGGEPLTLNAIAAAAAVSPRTLARGFRRYKDCAPASYLRALRLDRCRHELLDGLPEETSVTGVAAKWGFSNHGRFACAYRERFGENPADTLRRKPRR
jgi:AraC-like DNA-binding protein/mannose-6-phosphate isomerase-like protein (cupin superfamily)